MPWKDERGAVAVTYALALSGLILIGGAAFDYTRLVGMDTELQNGADQAALAGATQLDKGSGACARAGNAAVAMLRNVTLLSSTGNVVQINSGSTITVAANQCAGFAPTTAGAPFTVRFFSTYVAQGDAGNVAATGDADAKYIEVRVDEETARYAFTPVGSALRTLSARAVAGIGGAICGTAALSYCNPALPAGFNPDSYKGRGLLIGTMSNAFDGAHGTWGYLKIPPNNNSSTADIEEVLAQDEPTVECRGADDSPIAQPGSTSNLVRAINVRFDIFDNNIVNNNQPCETLSDCGPAANVIKDLVKSSGNKWVLPAKEFSPAARSGAYSASTAYQSSAIGVPDSMGLPRDLCHSGSYNASCASLGAPGDIGTGEWARQDYFAKYHTGRAPSNKASITRYETYLWEQAQGYLPSLNNISGGTNGTQYSQPVTVAASGGAYDRRVLTVAFTRGTNGSCPSANQSVPVVDWVDVFFVQPGVSKRGNYPAGVQENSSDPIYVEIIGRSKNAGKLQLTHREKPYLIE
jgi:Flp pilus assembly protein TadG